ncbi:response regulator transcription factor [Rhodococcus sp. Q]|uniref:response regulator transcription factor n=1 Tax=Rhodococcus sp. Q TaxID=2502252 RepID=UPI0010FA2CB2|nr:response regulator transcription factor [Rhodococcus sp. Q]
MSGSAAASPVPPFGKWRVGVVDDHEAVREGLKVLIDDAGDLMFVGADATVDGLLSLVGEVDVVVLDLRLADGSSPAQNVAVLDERGINTLVYTSGDEPYLVRQAAQAGVLGVLRKDVDKEQFQEAVRTAAAGRQVATMDWAAAVDSDPDFVDLSPRLRQVLELYASGEATQRVAQETGLSPDTVTDYVDRIRRRYRDAGRPAPTKTDLFKRAIEDGWLPIPRRFRR